MQISDECLRAKEPKELVFDSPEIDECSETSFMINSAKDKSK